MSAFGYERVSTDYQDNSKFKDEILRYSNLHMLGNVEFVEEIVSGTKSWKDRQLGHLINQKCKEGDVIIVPELSRLARSIQQIYEILTVCEQRKITLHIIKNGLVVAPDQQELTTKLTIGICAVFAEFERDIIVSRTKEALAAKKKAGIRLGRPKGPGKSVLDEHADEIKKFRDIGLSYAKIGKLYKVTPQTVVNWAKKHL